jgi:hypothetical protein
VKDTEELISEARGLLERVTANLVETCRELGMAPMEAQRAVLEHPDRRVIQKIILNLEMRRSAPKLFIIDDRSSSFKQLQRAFMSASPPVVGLENFEKDMLPDPIGDSKPPPRRTWKRKQFFSD